MCPPFNFCLSLSLSPFAFYSHLNHQNLRTLFSPSVRVGWIFSSSRFILLSSFELHSLASFHSNTIKYWNPNHSPALPQNFKPYLSLSLSQIPHLIFITIHFQIFIHTFIFYFEVQPIISLQEYCPCTSVSIPSTPVISHLLVPPARSYITAPSLWKSNTHGYTIHFPSHPHFSVNHCFVCFSAC